MFLVNKSFVLVVIVVVALVGLSFALGCSGYFGWCCLCLVSFSVPYFCCCFVVILSVCFDGAVRKLYFWLLMSVKKGRSDYREDEGEKETWEG